MSGADYVEFEPGKFAAKSSEAKPTEIISGAKTDISTVSAQLTTVDTPMKKSVLVTCDSLGTGTYIALGNATSREFKFEAVGDWHEIDYIDNLDKVYVDTDAGNTGKLSWIGG